MSKKSPLNEITGYYDMLSVYEENKNKPYNKWLEHCETFKNSGKQGIVGIWLCSTGYPTSLPEYIFRVSYYVMFRRGYGTGGP